MQKVFSVPFFLSPGGENVLFLTKWCFPLVQIYNYQGVFNEDYNIANTPAPNGNSESSCYIFEHRDNLALS